MSNENRGTVAPSERRWEIFDSLPKPIRDALNYADGDISVESTSDYFMGHGTEQTVRCIKESYPSKIRP